MLLVSGLLSILDNDVSLPDNRDNQGSINTLHAAPDLSAAALVALGEDVSQRVAFVYPDAVLKQIDVAAQGPTTFRFLTGQADCENDFPPAADSRIREFYAGKCDVLVRVPAAGSADQWQWQVIAPWQGDMGSPAVDFSAVFVGPERVGEVAIAQWPGCAPRNFTLAPANPQGTLTWYVFCVQPDGGTYRGRADPRTGAFHQEPGPAFPPPVVNPSP